MFLGPRTVIHPTDDLGSAKKWFAELLGVEPYFDQPFYVGFQVAGYELGLDPNAAVAAGPVTYWGVRSIDDALARLERAGAEIEQPATEVGESIRVARVRLPHAAGSTGIIENPHFREQEATGDLADGPGR